MRRAPVGLAALGDDSRRATRRSGAKIIGRKSRRGSTDEIPPRFRQAFGAVDVLFDCPRPAPSSAHGAVCLLWGVVFPMKGAVPKNAASTGGSASCRSVAIFVALGWGFSSSAEAEKALRRCGWNSAKPA